MRTCEAFVAYVFLKSRVLSYHYFLILLLFNKLFFFLMLDRQDLVLFFIVIFLFFLLSFLSSIFCSPRCPGGPKAPEKFYSLLICLSGIVNKIKQKKRCKTKLILLSLPKVEGFVNCLFKR